MVQNDVLDTAKMEGREEGREEGRAEGREEEKNDIARTMKEMGMSAEMISKATGLSEEDIERL